MNHDQYMRSAWPLWYSGIALAVASLLPLSMVLSDGWSSSVAWATFFAAQMAVFMPGFFLLHPRVFWLWLAFTVMASLAGNWVIHSYWNSGPDWMDAEIPAAVMGAIQSSIWIILGSSLLLGTLGWITYFRARGRAGHQGQIRGSHPADGGHK